MKELKQIVDNKLSELIDSGKLDEMVEKKFEACLNECISETFRSYGDLAKGVKESLEKNIKVDMNRVDFSIYNSQITTAMNAQLALFFKNSIQKQMADTIIAKMEPLPEEMTMKKFAEEIIAHWKVEEYHEVDDDDRVAEVEWIHPWPGNDSLDKYWTLKLKKKGKTIEVSFERDKCNNDIALISFGSCKTFDPSSVYDEELLIFKAYASKLRLTGLTDFDSNYEYIDLSLDDFDY